LNVTGHKLFEFWHECAVFSIELTMPRYYSLKDVAEHGTTESPWLIINNKVYDVTKLLSEVGEIQPSMHCEKIQKDN
jgi:cytochrome b involved in lipid metabolism